MNRKRGTSDVVLGRQDGQLRDDQMSIPHPTHKTEAEELRAEVLRIIRDRCPQSFAWEDVADEILALPALQQRLGREGGWRPIESAPRDGRHFFATYREEPLNTEVFQGHWMIGLARFNGTVFETENYRVKARLLTHWRHLPPPPGDESERGGADAARLREALEPFASLGSDYFSLKSRRDLPDSDPALVPNGLFSIRDFRRAYTALAKADAILALPPPPVAEDEALNALVEEHIIRMKEEVIPAIEKDLEVQRQAANRLRYGLSPGAEDEGGETEGCWQLKDANGGWIDFATLDRMMPFVVILAEATIRFSPKVVALRPGNGGKS